MGDRANVLLHESEFDAVNGGIYFYTHSGGWDLPEDLRKALTAAKPRWHDPQYAMRIIVSHLIGDDWRYETGYGLSTRMGDNSYPIIYVDFTHETVVFRSNGKARFPIGPVQTFEEYISKPQAWPNPMLIGCFEIAQDLSTPSQRRRK